RIADSVESALRICGSEARAAVQAPGEESWREISFQTSYRNPRTGQVLDELSPRHFSFNSHLGACEGCEGLGTEMYCDADLLVADPSKPLLKGGIRGWWPAGAARAKQFERETRALLAMFGLDESATYAQLPEPARQLLMEGGKLETGWKVGRQRESQSKSYEGLVVEAWRRHQQAKGESVRQRLLRLMAQRSCRACGGQRLKSTSLAVKVKGADWRGIQEFCAMSIAQAIEWIRGIDCGESHGEALLRLVEDIRRRLEFLEQVGLGYLTLDRASGTLSGGEAQRIRLATQLGAGLSGVIYVLDEPSIGLHAADTRRLIDALLRLRDLGNTVVVVEHDEAIIRAADHVIDMGPGAGAAGGSILAEAAPADLDSPTGKWLRSTRKLQAAGPRAQLATAALTIRGASEHNLRDLDVRIPLGCMVALCGPSGSGKSTLIDDILRRALSRHLLGTGDAPGAHRAIEGLERISRCVVADQAPIGRSPRSNPATLSGAFDLIRSLFAQLPMSRQRGYGPGRFSFNAAGGRCERCQGNGRLKIEMHFLPDAWVVCPACAGRRFNRQTLEVAYKGRSIADVLGLSVSEALALFAPIPKLRVILATLEELGLGYLPLGQAANTLSGGEAQRLKLAVELAKPPSAHTLYLLDEPTTGLHYGDVELLLRALRRLCDAGHSVLIIEHQLDVIAAADWVIELGPGGGVEGGSLIAEGPPAAILAHPDSPTGKALAANFQLPG
ncbi:MAG TPA: excinuclease ABC subunit UvrA, partial [Luteolibacter sp.]|nr:excinuclease ABC subunit UvrA [Luteolibacter sp.]